MPVRVDGPRAVDALHDPACTRCPRLVAVRESVRVAAPAHHAAPVAGVGRIGARLLIVGLAPGRLGANRTGIPFEGDFSGTVLWAALRRAGLHLHGEPTGAAGDWRIVNAVKCLPPGNRPNGAELANCRPFLRTELACTAADGVVLALGRTAHAAVMAALAMPLRAFVFAHGACGRTGLRQLVASYHPSRYNFSTGRLDQAMLDAVVGRAVRLSRCSSRPRPLRRA